MSGERATFSKDERLCHKRRIEDLFTDGKAITAFPIRLVYLPVEELPSPAQIVFAVGKKKLKKAVDRNTVKRRLRESYRLQKSDVYKSLNQPHTFMIIYLAKEILPSEVLRKAMTKAFSKMNSPLPEVK